MPAATSLLDPLDRDQAEETARRGAALRRLWGRNLLTGIGPYLFVGLLERYLRRRMKQRRALIPAVDDDGR
jgi:hypothetical protein